MYYIISITLLAVTMLSATTGLPSHKFLAFDVLWQKEYEIHHQKMFMCSVFVLLMDWIILNINDSPFAEDSMEPPQGPPYATLRNAVLYKWEKFNSGLKTVETRQTWLYSVRSHLKKWTWNRLFLPKQRIVHHSVYILYCIIYLWCLMRQGKKEKKTLIHLNVLMWKWCTDLDLVLSFMQTCLRQCTESTHNATLHHTLIICCIKNAKL